MCGLGSETRPRPPLSDASEVNTLLMSLRGEEALGDQVHFPYPVLLPNLNLLPPMGLDDLPRPQGIPLPVDAQGLVEGVPGLLFPHLAVAILHHLCLTPRGPDLLGHSCEGGQVVRCHAPFQGQEVNHLGHQLGGERGRLGHVEEATGGPALVLAGAESHPICCQEGNTSGLVLRGV
eukprot:7942314-Lingulodinium_polyedra.AAC.1